MDKNIKLYRNVLTREECQEIISSLEIFDPYKKECHGPRKVDLELDHPAIKNTAEKAWQVLCEYFKNYPLELADQCYELHHGQYSCFDPGSYYDVHVDSDYEILQDGIMGVRTVAVLCYLNEEFEGGELVFPDQDIKVKPETGMFAVFPTGYMYPHSVEMATDRRHTLYFFYYKVKDHNEIHYKNTDY